MSLEWMTDTQREAYALLRRMEREQHEQWQAEEEAAWRDKVNANVKAALLQAVRESGDCVASTEDELKVASAVFVALEHGHIPNVRIEY